MAHILLVDDDSATVEMIRRALEVDGHQVATAGDGSDGLAVVTSGQPVDLLIADVSMPQIDGITLAEKVRELVPGVRIVIMSAMADELVRAQQMAGAAVRVLNKPVTLDKMREQVRDLLA